MPNGSDKKSGWRQSLEERHLWPPEEWPKHARFMKLYFAMLFFILGVLGISFLLFMFRADVSDDSGMEVTIGITVGMFGILATFAVVFFAFRAEETAVSRASEIAKEFSARAFADEEDETFKMLVDGSRNSKEKKEESIYDGADTPGWQLCAWAAVFVLSLGSLVWFCLIFFFPEILPDEPNSNNGLQLQTLTLWVIGMLGVLITFTVVLFAARVAQLSQVAGRIKAHSIIEKLAASEENLYHELFEALDKICDHVKAENLPLAKVARFKLLQDGPQNFKRNELKDFNSLLDETSKRRKDKSGKRRIPPSNFFSRLIALVALLIICLIGFDMLRGEAASIRSIGGVISSSAVLFTFLIFSISVFFLGRVFRSAIASSREEAAKASYFEFDRKRIELKNRIAAVREIEKNKMLLDEFSASLKMIESVEDFAREVAKGKDLEDWKHQGVEEGERTIMKNAPVEPIVNMLMHLRHLKKNLEGQDQTMEDNLSSYFNKICEGPKEWLDDKTRDFEHFLMRGKVRAGFPSNKEDAVQMMERAREVNESVLRFTRDRAQPRREHYEDNDDYQSAIEFYNAYPEMDIEYYHEQDFLDYEKDMEEKKKKEELEKYLNARIEARAMVRPLIYMAKLCVMIKSLDHGLLVLKNDIMVRKENAKTEDAGTTTSTLEAVHVQYDGVIKTVIEILNDESFTFRTLDMGGSEPISTPELHKAWRSVRRLWKDLGDL